MKLGITLKIALFTFGAVTLEFVVIAIALYMDWVTSKLLINVFILLFSIGTAITVLHIFHDELIDSANFDRKMRVIFGSVISFIAILSLLNILLAIQSDTLLHVNLSFIMVAVSAGLLVLRRSTKQK